MAENPYNRSRDRRRETPDEPRASVAPSPPISGSALPAAPVNPYNNRAQIGIRAPLAAGEVDWSQYNKPFGELKEATWSPSERMAHDVQDVLMKGGASASVGRHLGEGVINIGRLNPVANLVTSGADLGYHLPRGEYGKAVFDALGLVPAAMYGSKFVRGQTMARDADIPRSVFDKSYQPERQLFGKPDQYGMRPGGGYGPALPSSRVPKDELKVAGEQGYNRVAASPVLWHPNALNDNIYKTVNELRSYGTHGQPHTPENSPEFYAAMTRWYNNHAGRATPVTALEWDQLRRELRALPSGPSGIAGGKAADRIDDYMHTPPPGSVVQGNQQQLDALRGDLTDARGNWRAYKTADTIERSLVDAKNSARVHRSDEGSAVQSVLDQYANTPAGREAIYGATQNERATIGQAAQGTGGNWLLNKIGDIGMSGKAAGIGGTLGGSLGGALGLDWGTAAALASAGAGAPLVAGGVARWGARPGMARSAQDALDEIRMNSPLFRQQSTPVVQTLPAGFSNVGPVPAPGRAPIEDPSSRMRDAIAYAMTPQIQREGQDIWAGLDAPYEPKKQEQY